MPQLSPHTSLAQLRAMTMPRLRDLLTQRQLPIGGNKQTLAQRILNNLQAGQEADPGTSEGPPSEEEDEGHACRANLIIHLR